MLVTVCVPVCFEFEFLKGTIREIQKNKHPEIDYEIIICDQTSPDMSEKIHELYKNEEDIKVVKVKRIDAGYPLDVAVRMAKGEYFCSLDVDAFPISNLWLYLPIKLIEKFGLSFIGKETRLHDHYSANLGPFFHLNNYFRISKTDIAKKISEDVGFIRPTNKSHAEIEYKNVEIPMFCDNGVIAQWYSDYINAGPKLSLTMNRIIGITPAMGVYGMVIDDLVFHMVFGQTKEEYGIGALGNDYSILNNEINQNGLTEDLVEKLLSLSTEELMNSRDDKNDIKFNNRILYKDGKEIHLDENHEITQYINQLRNER